jgi:membrane associated rhomboid family serine protease
MTTDATLPTCARHPDRETRLVCPRCGRPTCDLCLTASDDARVCQICREESGLDNPAPATPVRRPAQAAAPITVALLVVFVAVFAVGTLSGGLASEVLSDGAQINELVMAGQWWRVLTATLLHSGITHLLFNGYALYVLGAQLERGVGSVPFAALYVASALAGGIAFLLAAPQQVAVGASGAIFGLFGAWFAASWVNRDTPQGRAGVSQLGLLLLVNLALPLFIRNIAWQAHLGGLVAGALIGLGWARLGRRDANVTPAARVTFPVTTAGALLAGLLWYTWA